MITKQITLKNPMETLYVGLLIKLPVPPVALKVRGFGAHYKGLAEFQGYHLTYGTHAKQRQELWFPGKACPSNKDRSEIRGYASFNLWAHGITARDLTTFFVTKEPRFGVFPEDDMHLFPLIIRPPVGSGAKRDWALGLGDSFEIAVRIYSDGAVRPANRS